MVVALRDADGPVRVAAYLFTCEPQTLTSETAYTFEHPPQALRMNLLMKSVKTWCFKNRQALHEWLEPFQRLMNLVAAATWGMNGGNDWSEQITFLRSPEGRRTRTRSKQRSSSRSSAAITIESRLLVSRELSIA